MTETDYTTGSPIRIQIDEKASKIKGIYLYEWRTSWRDLLVEQENEDYDTEMMMVRDGMDDNLAYDDQAFRIHTTDEAPPQHNTTNKRRRLIDFDNNNVFDNNFRRSKSKECRRMSKNVEFLKTKGGEKSGVGAEFWGRQGGQTPLDTMGPSFVQG